MPFQPGISGNPRGRKPGWRKKAQPWLGVTLEGDNAPDSLEYLASVVAADKAPTSYRIQAAAVLAPFQHSKSTVRLISTPIELPAADNVEDAASAIAKLPVLAAAGTIGLDEAGDLANLMKAYIEARVALDNEARLARIEEMVARLSPPTIEVAVTGGMPNLPGTDVILPERTSILRVERSERSRDEPE
jgi:hypothetical protein